MTDNPNLSLFINPEDEVLDITNEDGNSLRDLLPPFMIPNILGYLDRADALSLLDAHDETVIYEVERLFQIIEDAAVLLHQYDPSRHDDWLAAMIAIAENS